MGQPVVEGDDVVQANTTIDFNLFTTGDGISGLIIEIAVCQ